MEVQALPELILQQKNANEPSAKGKHQLSILLSTKIVFTDIVNKQEYNTFPNNLIRT